MSGQSVILKREADLVYDAYRVEADAANRVGILLLPEMFGVSPAMRDAAEDFAAEGYTTLVPNLFWRHREYPAALGYEGEERQIAFERLQALDLDAAVADIDSAATALSETDIDAIVAVGHCIGGRLAVLALPRTRLGGAVSYYGLGISRQGKELAQLRKPAQLHYGLADEHVPLAEIQAVMAFMEGNSAIDVYCYENAGHSFCNPYRPMYDRAAAALVKRRTLAFLADIARR